MAYVSKPLNSDVLVRSFLNKNPGILTRISNINGMFIFGNNEIFNDIPNTHYKFIKSNDCFIIVRNGIVINYLINDKYVWLYEEVKDSLLCNEFDFISNDQKQKIVESIKSMSVLNELYK